MFARDVPREDGNSSSQGGHRPSFLEDTILNHSFTYSTVAQ